MSLSVSIHDCVDATQQNVSAGLRQAAEVAGGIGDKAITIVKRHPIRTVLLLAACAAIAGFIAGVLTAKRV